MNQMQHIYRFYIGEGIWRSQQEVVARYQMSVHVPVS